MSTIDERWNIVNPTRAFCQKVLPLVYDESLSYMELVCKVSSKLNEVIENNNNLPQYVKDLIKETVKSDEFTQIVGSVLMDTIINVKFPPEGITPAKGDGVTDDTSSIQACFDYANSQGGAVVFFPSGKYLTGTLSINTETSILGADRYNTHLVLKGGGNTPLLQGAINQSIRNICLDGNRLNQVKENYLIDGEIDKALFDNVILCDSAHCIAADACNNSEFCNVMCKEIGDGVFITASGNNNLLTNINTEYAIDLTGNNNNWQSQQQTKIDSEEPLIYKEPQKLNDYFNYIPMQFNNTIYSVLVDGDVNNIPCNYQLNASNLFRYIGLTKGDYNYPQGGCFVNNNYMQAFVRVGDDNSAQIREINIETGDYTSFVLNNVGHCNDLTYDGFSLIIAPWTKDNNEVNEIYTINLLTKEVVIIPVTFTPTSCVYHANNYYILDSNNNIHYGPDINNLEFAKKLQLPNGINYSNANKYKCSLFSDGQNMWFSTAFPTTLYKLDNDFNCILCLSISEKINGGFNLRELESVDYKNGQFYLCGASGSGKVGSYKTITRFANVNLVNPVNGGTYCNNLSPVIQSQTSIYVNNSAYDYKANGTREKPFYTVQEAIDFVTLNNKDTNTQILITGNYDETINIEGLEKNLDIFGQGERDKITGTFNIENCKIDIRSITLEATDVVNISKSDVYMNNVNIIGDMQFYRSYAMLADCSITGTLIANYSTILNTDHLPITAYNGSLIVGKGRYSGYDLASVDSSFFPSEKYISVSFSDNIASIPNVIALENTMLIRGWTDLGIFEGIVRLMPSGETQITIPYMTGQTLSNGCISLTITSSTIKINFNRVIVNNVVYDSVKNETLPSGYKYFTPNYFWVYQL